MSCFYITLQLIPKVVLTLFSISSSLKFWSINHTSMYRGSESKVFENKTFLGELSNNYPKDLLGTNI